ncbi:MAG: bifunctional phosphopantothenoylcysteine decarboxylase/phosphopantothenate--cysteine ligase CoaBC [Candidatus Eremiobacteraeota bacterium]|nr:bifunctional phosphopantothenoylcysteine decarboxylase/phosphopantothenate--cysteine ligase CoaBC [Candidatus Eremiobacteraeota bacterium]
MTQTLESARILLCVTGGIAAYKAAALTSTLVQSGARVDVMMTTEAERFIGPLTFSSLTARPTYTSLWDAPERIPHIRLVREAQVAVVIPATANIIAKLANGISDDLVTTALLAARIPVVVAPAMNSAMWENPATQINLTKLRERNNYTLVSPEAGFLAERESGVGRLPSEDALLVAIERALNDESPLQGKRVVVTAGPTREFFDPVRYVGNPSTGSMGFAIARAAFVRGADVQLILGPSALVTPPGIDVRRVTTAQEMYDAAQTAVQGADIVVAAAAVSDWRPARTQERKVKKSDGDLNVVLTRNPDVLASFRDVAPSAFIVGFAAETNDHEANAREKLSKKNLDAIAVNDVSGTRGFGAGENHLTLLWGRDSREDLGGAPKDELAQRFWNSIEALIAGKAPHAARD